MQVECSSCHKKFPEPYMLKVQVEPYPQFSLCYDCARQLNHPAILGKARPKTDKCTMCDKRFTPDKLTNYKEEPLCQNCLTKLRARRAAFQPASQVAPRILGNSLHKRLLDRQNELLREQARLRSGSQPLILRDQIKLETHTRNDAMAKALSPRAGYFEPGALQDSQRLRKRAEAIEALSRRPQPRAYASIDALVKGQKNSRKADGLSAPAPGDTTAGAEQVMVSDRSRPQSYGGFEPSRRDDSFIDILPGRQATSDLSYDPYPDSATLRPDWLPGGNATPMTQADASQREVGIRLFTGDSSAFFKPATRTDRFLGSTLVVRDQNQQWRQEADLGKLALDLAMKLRRAPKFFGRNL